MTKLESIVVSNTEPNNKNVLWYDNKRLLIFSNGHWSPIVDLDDIDVDNLPGVSNLQEALKSLNIKVDNKETSYDIYKIYSDGDSEIRALDGISLRVSKGEFVAIVGSSGSGKSTCMNIIGCLDTPTSGEDYLNGTDVSTMWKCQ